MLPHNPNPFDFVPFAKSPLLKTPQEFDALGDPLSGYLDVRLEALTPLHIAGFQTAGASSGTSRMYRQGGAACIPGASIRGCLRAFIEALTSGWVSQVNLVYPKKDGHRYPNEGRHIGFRAFDNCPPEGKSVINQEYEARLRPDHQIDVASYLFGMVLEKQDDIVSTHADLARKSKILIEDAYLNAEDVQLGENWVPDISGTSFMGGGKPSASTWWYMTSLPWQTRQVQGGRRTTIEFIGNEFRGRKFYYHQEPEHCVDFYKTWKFDVDHKLYPVYLECQKRAASTQAFRVYLTAVPRPLVILLILALNPGKTIRHKLGYGKAYGYGSVAFSIEKAMFRPDNSTTRLPTRLEDFCMSGDVQKWAGLAWQEDALTSCRLESSILDFQALKSLARVLGWPDHERLLFTYPPYDELNFKKAISDLEYKQNSQLASTASSLKIAEDLFGIKKTVHFRYYQEHAQGFDIIAARNP
jgi:CRISPR/Cas system CSM-associated protein Csm3 (group 7 of RAMP superfamily)